MKRFVCIICAIALCVGMTGALADTETFTQSMTKVTQIVKTALDISDDYDDFNGTYSYGKWYLNWSTDDSYLGVVCDSDGTVLSYYNNDYTDSDISLSALNAAIPKYDEQGIRDAAEEFLSRVITKQNYAWQIDDVQLKLYRGYANNALVTGTLTLYDCPSDIGFYVRVDSMSGTVTSFYRYDCYRTYTEGEAEYIQSDIDRSKIASQIINALDLELVYSVIDTDDMARLVYVPASDAQIAWSMLTGELIKISDSDVVTMETAEAEEDAAYGSAKSSDNSALRELSESELKSIALYDDVMSAEEIDALLKSMPELGLIEADIMQDANYWLVDSQPIAHIRYYRAMDDGEYIEHNVQLDAVTGRLKSLYTYSSAYSEYVRELDDTTPYRQVAEAFLAKYFEDYAQSISLSSESVSTPIYGNKPVAQFTYVRQHAGYPFKANRISISVNTMDGTISGLYVNWDDDQEFYEPETDKLIALDDAKALWIGNAELIDKFVSLPKSDARIGTIYTLTHCLIYDIDGIYALDATSGERYVNSAKPANTYEYQNTQDMLYADEIVLLGSFGIGLGDCNFTESDMLSARQLMMLSLQAYGYTNLEEYTVEQLEKAFKSVFGSNALNADAEEILSRADATKALIKIAGYGNTAQLEGIWKSDAADWDDVPLAYQGSMAIAQALNLIDAYDNKLNPNQPATAAMFVHALYKLMTQY